MKRSLAVLLNAYVTMACIKAQIDILTVREAESVVERVPDVVAATNKGECPLLSATYAGDEQVDFQVRRSCGSNIGTLINNYTVNRRTGLVKLWGDDPQAVADESGRSLAKQLLVQARRRVLSGGEAACLALEAAKSIPGWREAKATIAIEPLGNSKSGRLEFNATFRELARPATAARSISVDLTTGRTRDNETGQDLDSAGTGGLKSKILKLRNPPWLTDVDALSVALEIPELASRAKDPCRLWAGGAVSSTTTQVRLACDGRVSNDAPIVTVNLQTGQIVDGRTGKLLESPEARRVAQQLLADRERERMLVQKDLGEACHNH